MRKIEVERRSEGIVNIFTPNNDGSFFHLKTVNIKIDIHKGKSLAEDLSEAFRVWARVKKAKGIEYQYEGSSLFCNTINCSLDGGFLNVRPILVKNWEKLGLEK